MDIISRDEAKRQGLTQYFTGKPCKRGHLSPRNVSSYNCLECWREDARRARQEDPTIFRQQKQQEYQRNKDRILEQQRRYRVDNWDAILERRRTSTKYKEYMNEYFKSYYKDNDEQKAKLLSRTRRRQLAKRQATLITSREEQRRIDEMYLKAIEITKETGIPHEVDHIVPIQGETVCGLHCLANLQIITKTENVRKSNKFTD